MDGGKKAILYHPFRILVLWSTISCGFRLNDANAIADVVSEPKKAIPTCLTYLRALDRAAYFLVPIVMDFIIRKSMRNSPYGINWKSGRLTNLDFADDKNRGPIVQCIKITSPTKSSSSRTGLQAWSKSARVRRLRLAGHILRLTEDEPVNTAVNLVPEGGKRRQDRPVKTWCIAFMEDLRQTGVTWRKVADDCQRWRNLVAQCPRGDGRN